MSAKDGESKTIYMTDTPKMIKDKINKYAFSGGQATKELQQQLGANLDVDVSIKYLEIFMDDDVRLNEIKEKYKKGEMLTGEVKKVFIEVITNYILGHQERRAKLSDDDVLAFGKVRKMS